MALGDQAGLEAIKLINAVTIPKAQQAVSEIIDKLNNLVLNLANGAVITITITIPKDI
jgi:hypothetical protein